MLYNPPRNALQYEEPALQSIVSRNRSDLIDSALVAEVSAHPRDLTRTVAAQLGISRQAVAARVRVLVDDGYLASSGTTRPTYVLGVNRRGHFDYALAGLAEDRVWSRDVAPLLRDLSQNVVATAHHGLTEMVNNAIDHSEGTQVRVVIHRNAERVTMQIIDNGIGIFHKIARALNLPDERLALLELSKGKFTTDPKRHTGEGVFFTSRMCDHFQIVSGGLVFDHDSNEELDVLCDADSHPKPNGTVVHMAINVASTRSPEQIFSAFSSGPDDYTFAKTIVPVRLAQLGDENLISRSQAKRLMQRVDQFRCVVLDFEGVNMIGRAFSDEVFRVFANDHPNVELVAINAAPEVQQMIRRAEVARDENGQISLI